MAKRKLPERAKERASLLASCAELVLPERAGVAVVGGGAAGLVAAITAAEAGADVIVIEAAPECGRSILATGGGRCNFANADLAAEAYNDPAFAAAVMGAEPLADILAFFEESGLAWCEEEGRLYPRSMAAASVRELLLARAERAGVLLACGREAVAAAADERGFELRLRPAFEGPEEALRCGSLVIATGGGADLASELGLPMHPLRPGLCALAARGLPFERLDGRRARVRAVLSREGAQVADETGEMLFRPWGVSGIVSFDLSRFALPGDELAIDLAPELSDEAFRALVGRAGSAAGVVDPQIASVLADEFGSVPKTVRIVIEGTADEQHAQLTLGGIATEAFDSSTLASREADGLFACGEALDIDGRCGGYNLAFAWLSGMRAGASAAARAVRP